MHTETWRPVAEFEGLYEVSNLGRVRGVRRLSTDGRTLKAKNLKPVTAKNNGYSRVGLWKDGRYYVKTVHRIVATAFIQNPDNKSEVNHKNGDKADNRAENLEWVTASENQKHALVTGLRHLNDPAHSKRVGMFTTNGLLIQTFPSVAEASRTTKISAHVIYKRCSGTYAGRPGEGYVWRYLEA